MLTLSTSLIRRSFNRSLAVATIALVAACNSSSDVNSPTLVATSIAASAGIDGQSSTVGQATPTEISVTVLDQNGAPISNATVTWTVLSGGGSAGVATSTTSTSGVALVVWTLGTAVGTNTLQASLASGASVTITAIGVAGPAAALSIVSGNNQAVSLGVTTADMQLRVADQYGNAVNAASVIWTSSAGTLATTTTTTDANGLTSTTLTTDASTTSYLVTATVGNMSTSYTITAN